ncbi:MAG: hypothetical protein ABL894_02145 [Hyphomicrobium sp.]
MNRINCRHLILATALVFAQFPDTAAHDVSKGPNGGALVDVSGHHVEFVPSAAEITFFLTGDADAPIASAGAKAKAIVQEGGKTTQIELVPVDPNKLVGKPESALGAGAKVVFTGTLSDGHSIQAKFSAP